MEGNLQNTAPGAGCRTGVHPHKLSPAVLTAVGRCHDPYFTAEEIGLEKPSPLSNSLSQVGFFGKQS